MKKLSVYLLASVALAVCAMMSSCKSDKILSAGFEGDGINSPPNKTLPGDPAGDEIQYNSALDPQLRVQASTIAGSKSLHFTNVSIADPGGHQRWVSFRGIGTNLTETVWFLHTGQNTGAAHDVLIDVSDGHAHLIARMRIRSDGEVALAKNILDNYTDVIGNVGSEVHTVIFTCSASTLKYNVSIYKTTGPAILAENKPMITENALSFNNPAHPTLSFQHSASSAAGHTYAIGSVSITRKKP
jgi:hypothetical protein